MRKQLQRQDTGFLSSHQGCMWSLMHILDYHRWHSVKKILPGRKHSRGRIRGSGSRKATLKNRDNGEKKELSAEAEPLPAISQEEVMESSPSKKPITSNQLKKDISHDQFYDHVDLLELIKANKDFFLKFLQDPDVNRNQFPGLHKSNTKVRLTKSSSFPVADSSRARSVMPSTLKHKQNEIWSFPKGEKLLASTRAPKLVTSESQEDLPEGFRYQGWNQLVMSRFKDIKQKLMHAPQESKKGNTPTSTETLVPEDPSGCDGKEMSETPEMITGEERSKIDGLDDTLGKRKRRVSRTSSLDESLNRYSQLFESSCRSEAKLHHSMSLKLRSEEKVSSTGNAQKSTRRNLSLPDLDSLCSFLNGPPRDAFRLGIPVKNVVDHKTSKENDSHIGPKSVSLNVDTDKSERLEAILETEFQNSIDEQSDREDLHEYVVEPEEEEESRTHEQRDIGFTMSPEGEKAQPSESCTLESYSSELSISEELCSSAKCEQTEIEQTNMDHHSSQFVHKMDDPELNYVRDVLELSGFMGNEYLGTWYSMDQPLDPSVVKELEARFHHQHEITGNWDHQLLFDLVNETLLDIHERSYTYFPRALSFSGSKHRPMPKGQHLLEDVWTRISSYMSFRPELVQSLDDILARDLAKADTWMNLQWETECVALELEDLIFEELLDEVICS
ncbi:protein TRM32 [Rosa sericea]